MEGAGGKVRETDPGTGIRREMRAGRNREEAKDRKHLSRIETIHIDIEIICDTAY